MTLKNLKDLSMEFDLENPLTDSQDLNSDSVSSLFLTESDHTPSQNYFLSLQAGDLDVLVRREAIASISQVPKTENIYLYICIITKKQSGFCILYRLSLLVFFS